MKKVISLLLSVIMLFGMLAVTAAAHTFEQSAKFITSSDIPAGETCNIPEGITMTVPSDVTLYIPAGSKLIVQDGGVLNVLGTVVVLAGGELKVEGTILHGTNVSVEQGTNAKATAVIRFPAVNKYISDALEADGFGVTVKAIYEYDGTGTKTTTDVTAGTSVEAELGSVINIEAKITEPEAGKKYYDNKYFTIYEKGVALTYVNGVCPLTVTGSTDITYVKAQSKADFYRDCKIYLPSGTGYQVTGRNGEVTEDGTVLVKCGTTFSFTLGLDEDYDRSNINVYVYNGYGYINITSPIDGTMMADLEPLQPDADGYYTIEIEAGSTEKTILVDGVISNSTISTATGVMDTVRYILDMITSFFKKIAELFGIKM